jgi:ceramide synthetase
MKEEWKNRSMQSNVRWNRDPFIILTISLVFVFLRQGMMRIIGKRILKSSPQREEYKKNIKYKFYTSMWRFYVYSCFAMYGVLSLMSETWVLSPFQYTLTWKDNQVPLKARVHYFLEFSHYLTGLAFIFHEPRMSDHYQMILHHIITLLLIYFSYYINGVRYGVVVMLIHDISDPFMESAKLALYYGNQRMADVMFCVFSLVFVISRIIIYPGLIIMPSTYYLFQYGWNTILFLLNLLLLLLYLLNIIWSCFIAKMVISFVRVGKCKGDVRSDDTIIHGEKDE